MNADFLIIGAGFSGLVLAERLTNSLDVSCLLVERRSHLGGNAQDEYDDHGVLIHKYGPHYFRTDSQAVYDYLSRFTQWIPARYEILARTQGRDWPFPVNLDTYEKLIGRPASESDFLAYLEKARVPCLAPANSEDAILAKVGREIYDLFYKGYTRKQWGVEASKLDAAVCSRVPIRTNRDRSYVGGKYQVMPAAGYHRVFERLLASCRKTQVLLNAAYREVRPQVQYQKLIYTGAIDEFFGHCAGVLPYRSLRFESEHFTAEDLDACRQEGAATGFWQPAVQVNYPNDFEFTRIVEAKHITAQACTGTTIVREYPKAYTPGGEPYYPVLNAASRRQYQAYQALAAGEADTYFAGRLGTYRYLNMDQVVQEALGLAEVIIADWNAGTRRRTACLCA